MTYAGQGTSTNDSPEFNNVQIDNQGQIAFRELNPNGSQSVIIKAPASLDADVNITLPINGGSSGQCWHTDGAGNTFWASPTTPYFEATAQSSTTTNSSSANLMSAMTITPGAGTWKVEFTCECQSSNSARTIELSIYANGSLQTDSPRKKYFATSNQPDTWESKCFVTVAAGQAIEGRWSISNNTATNNRRSLILTKMSD